MHYSSGDIVRKEKLLILGSGWGSFKAAKLLDKSKFDIYIVSPRNHFVFTPLLASTTTGVLEFRSIMEPVRLIESIQFYQGYADQIDFDGKKVHCSEWDDANRLFEVSYDKLIIGIGADNNTFNIPGVKPGNVFFLKELRDSRVIRNKIIDILERASIPGITSDERSRLLHFVVVGGGPTGVEFAAELSDFFCKDISIYYPNIASGDIKITLIEAGDTILPAFTHKLVQKAVISIRKQGINMLLHTRVKAVEHGKIHLEDDTTIDTELIVWSTGVGPRPLVSRLENVSTESGRLIVDEFLQLQGHPDVFALGDCAQVEGHNLPASAQVAQQQAKFLARYFNRKADNPNQVYSGFKYRPLGLMTYIGGSVSILDSEWVGGTGWVEFIAWRSVYLCKIGTLKNALQIPYNWLKTVIWGHDITNF